MYCSVRWHSAPMASEITRSTLFGTLASAPGNAPRMLSRTSDLTCFRVGVAHGIASTPRWPASDEFARRFLLDDLGPENLVAQFDLDERTAIEPDQRVD